MSFLSTVRRKRLSGPFPMPAPKSSSGNGRLRLVRRNREREICMTEGLYLSRAKLSTRLAFVAAGFGVACWAPLVPFAKTRCHLGDDTMGLVLLLLGAGSIVAMPLAANLSARFSSKPIVLSSGLGLAAILPLLSIVSSPIALGAALFGF